MRLNGPVHHCCATSICQGHFAQLYLALGREKAMGAGLLVHKVDYSEGCEEAFGSFGSTLSGTELDVKGLFFAPST